MRTKVHLRPERTCSPSSDRHVASAMRHWRTARPAVAAVLATTAATRRSCAPTWLPSCGASGAGPAPACRSARSRAPPAPASRLVLLAGLQQRLGQVGVRAGLVDRPGRERHAEHPDRVGRLTGVERQPAERACDAARRTDRSATTRFSAACIRAGSALHVEQRHQLAAPTRRRNDRSRSGSRAPSPREPCRPWLSADLGNRACGLSAPVAFGTSAAAFSKAAIAASGLRSCKRLAQRHLRREAVGIRRRERLEPDRAARRASSPRAPPAPCAARRIGVSRNASNVFCSASMSTPSTFLIARFGVDAVRIRLHERLAASAGRRPRRCARRRATPGNTQARSSAGC